MAAKKKAKKPPTRKQLEKELAVLLKKIEQAYAAESKRDAAFDAKVTDREAGAQKLRDAIAALPPVGEPNLSGE
jgi:hypothetical protein